MDWIQAFTIIGVLSAIMFYMIQRLENDINANNRRMDGHAQRIDQLYQVIVDILRQGKK